MWGSSATEGFEQVVYGLGCQGGAEQKRRGGEHRTASAARRFPACSASLCCSCMIRLYVPSKQT